MGWIAPVWSGLVATLAALAFFWVARSLEWTRFSPTIQAGCLIVPDPRRPITETVGFVLLLVIGSTLLPLVFQIPLGVWGGPMWIGGVVVGGFAGLATAGMLPGLGMISACVRSGVVPPPGPFGIGWGRPTPAVILVGAMIYGAVLATVLAGF
jgi:hypothetical protein